MSNWRDRSSRIWDSLKSHFGETITYTPAVGDPVEIQAMIDKAFISLDPASGAAQVSTKPMIGVKKADLEADPKADDTVEMRGATYRVVEVQDDGQAGWDLILHKAAS